MAESNIRAWVNYKNTIRKLLTNITELQSLEVFSNLCMEKLLVHERAFVRERITALIEIFGFVTEIARNGQLTKDEVLSIVHAQLDLILQLATAVINRLDINDLEYSKEWCVMMSIVHDLFEVSFVKSRQDVQSLSDLSTRSKPAFIRTV